MFIKIHEIKEVLYICQTLLGVLLVVASYYQSQLASGASNPLSHLITAMVLFPVGCVCIFFGVETYLLREDPDIWR